MYLAVCIVAIEDKGVAALCADTAVEHGLLIGQFAIHQSCPFLGREVRTVVEFGAVVEVSLESLGRVDVLGAATALGIVHIHRCTTVIHQHGHRLGLRCGVGGLLVVGNHVVPIVRGTKLGRCLLSRIVFSIGIESVGIGGFCGLGGVAMVIHHLRHRRGHTARHVVLGRFARCVGGALVVVGSVLVPLRGEQRTYRLCQSHVCGQFVGHYIAGSKQIFQ